MRLRGYQRHRPDGRPRPLAAAAAILMVASLASTGLRRRGDSAGANGAELGSTLKLALWVDPHKAHLFNPQNGAHLTL